MLRQMIKVEVVNPAVLGPHRDQLLALLAGAYVGQPWQETLNELGEEVDRLLAGDNAGQTVAVARAIDGSLTGLAASGTGERSSRTCASTPQMSPGVWRARLAPWTSLSSRRPSAAEAPGRRYTQRCWTPGRSRPRCC